MSIKISFVCGTNNEETLTKNLLRSPITKDKKVNVHVFPDPDNLPKVYNFLPLTGLVCYIHHDVYLPRDWEADLMSALINIPTDWGVLGVAGATYYANGRRFISGHILDRGTLWGNPVNLPAEVDTLDEMLLITRGDLVFDERFPFDFYGADICLQARAQGRKCYAIKAFCEHNSTRKVGERTPAFYNAEDLFREKWKDQLPIATTCTILKKASNV
jgi:hypothetical protein